MKILFSEIPVYRIPVYGILYDSVHQPVKSDAQPLTWYQEIMLIYY